MIEMRLQVGAHPDRSYWWVQMTREEMRVEQAVGNTDKTGAGRAGRTETGRLPTMEAHQEAQEASTGVRQPTLLIRSVVA